MTFPKFDDLTKSTMIISFWGQHEKFQDRKTAITNIVFSSINTFEGTAHVEGKKNEENYLVRDGEIDKETGFF